MNNYIECEVRINGFDLLFRRKSLGCYDVYMNNMVMFEDMTKDSEQYNSDTKAIVSHIKKLIKEENAVNARSSIKDLDDLSVKIGEDDVKVKIDRRLNMKLKLVSTTKKRFINEAIAEKLEKEGLLWFIYSSFSLF